MAGRAFVSSSAGDSKWCRDCFAKTIVQVPDSDEIYVVDSSGDGQRLQEYQQRHNAVVVHIHMQSRSEPMPVRCYILQQSVNGAWGLWSLSSWYEQAMGSQAPTTCSRWYQNWWQWWRKHIQAFQLDDAHLRKPAVVVGKAEDHYRFLPDAVASSPALIALLSRWAAESKSSTAKNEQGKAAWRACLKGMVDTYFGADSSYDWAVFLDVSASSRPGLPIVGNNRVVLPVRRGKVMIFKIILYRK